MSREARENPGAAPRVAIREATAADRPAIDALFAALQEHERGMEPNRLPADACGPHVDHLLRWTAEGGLVLLAEAGGRPVGLLIAGLRDAGAYVLPENRIHVDVSDLYVAPEARRRGLGLGLLAHAEAHFRARGFRRMEIGALAVNDAALALYRRWAGAPHAALFARNLSST